MIDRELAEHFIDYTLAYSPMSIVEVDPKEKTAIGSCESKMTLYIFNFETSCEDDKCHSVVIADSEDHGIRVFVLMNLHADNLFIKENDNGEDAAEIVANMGGIYFPKGNGLDFRNALRIVEIVRTVTWN